MSRLAERLRQLRGTGASSPRGAESSPGAASPVPLESVERELLGDVADGLSLKQRLERLVEAASRGRSRPARPAAALEELVPGRVVTNAHGEFFLLESDLHLETRHGDLSLSRFHAVLPETVGILTADPELGRFDLASAVFLDTETTGLAGGSGTAAFLIGIGFVDGDRFRVRQYFMRDYHEEPALLHELARDLARFEHLVTFNGKMFDVPLLETRYRLLRARFPLQDAAHLDLLHPARRLWKLRRESCRLQALEASLLGVRRHGDVPGEEIPRLYFEYVRSRQAGELPRVLEHNRLDIVSLAALAVRACRWIEEDEAEDPRDLFSLGRVLERAEQYGRSDRAFQRAVDAGAGELRAAALLRLAERARRAGDHASALRLFEQAGDAGEALAFRQLAVHHEHRSRDLAAALAAAERGLALAEDTAGPIGRRAAEDFRRRHARVRRKLALGREA